MCWNHKMIEQLMSVEWIINVSRSKLENRRRNFFLHRSEQKLCPLKNAMNGEHRDWWDEWRKYDALEWSFECIGKGIMVNFVDGLLATVTNGVDQFLQCHSCRIPTFYTESLDFVFLHDLTGIRNCLCNSHRVIVMLSPWWHFSVYKTNHLFYFLFLLATHFHKLLSQYWPQSILIYVTTADRPFQPSIVCVWMR